eukprot:c3915_g1_i1.p1 GENE.c3915_g1_i1~~c3915_g1_i1.p1  ORF type:complete len:446 (-),score=144.65 c3915_g1_i1:6-1343(-)
MATRSAAVVHVINFLIYAHYIFALNFPVPLMAVIKKSLDLTSGQTSMLSSYGLTGEVVGHFVNGWLADRFGPRRSLIAGYTVLFISILVYANSFDFTSISISSAFMSFSGSVIWPAFTIVIGYWFATDHKEMDRGILVLSCSSRVSATASVLTYAVLSYALEWRVIATIAAVIAIFGALWCLLLVWDSPNELVIPGPPLSWDKAVSTMKFLFNSKGFIECIFITSCATCIRFLDPLYGPFFTDISLLDEREVAFMTLLPPLGFIFGLLILGPIFNSLESFESKRIFVVISQIFCVMFLITLAFISKYYSKEDYTVIIGGILIFFLTSSISIQYYLIPTMFEIQFGVDDKQIGVMGSYISGFSFIFAMIVYYIMGIIVDSSIGWLGVWFLLAFIQALSCFVLWDFFNVLFSKETKERVVVENSNTSVEYQSEQERLLGGKVSKRVD